MRCKIHHSNGNRTVSHQDNPDKSNQTAVLVGILIIPCMLSALYMAALILDTFPQIIDQRRSRINDRNEANIASAQDSDMEDGNSNRKSTTTIALDNLFLGATDLSQTETNTGPVE